jgi:AbrB family looped-hinge helix DNA binding protein
LELNTSKVGKRGSVVIPATLRRRFGIEEGSLVIAEAVDGGVLIRPAVAVPVETYAPERRAEFLLSNATDRRDYERARDEVRAMGLDPEAVPHYRPDDGP